MQTNPERLAEAVKARRDELDLTQLDVWQGGGPSNTTLTKIENAEAATLSRTTARKLDFALKWEPGSAKRIFDQAGEPLAILREGMSGKNSAWLRTQIKAADLDPRTRDRLIETLDQERGAS